jgi:hypothetical protein
LVLVLLAGGRCFSRAGTSILQHRRLNVDVLDALAVVLQGQGRGGPLQAFQSLWEPLIMPAVGLLMAAALLSGILGWWQRRGQP